MFGKKKNKKESVEDVLAGLNDHIYQGALEKELAEDKEEKNSNVSNQSTQEKCSCDQACSCRTTCDCGKVQELSADAYPRAVYAGFWMRLIAFGLDVLFCKCLSNICFSGITYFLGEEILVKDGLFEFFVMNGVFVAYFTLTSFFLEGQTLGKYFCKLKVVATQSGHLSLGTCLIREGLGKLILYRFPILGLCVLFTPQRQNYIDFFTDTLVISLEKFHLMKGSL